MQRVDPFIPITDRRNLPPKRPLGQVPERHPEANRPGLEGIKRRPAAPPRHEPIPLPEPAAIEQNTAKPKHRWLKKLQLPFSALGILVLGFLLQSLIIGQVLIAAFGVVAFWRRVESRTIFTLALLLIAGIITLLLVGTNIQLVTNFAVYAFLLFAVGAVQLGREVLYD